jgi:hypothetical protein
LLLRTRKALTVPAHVLMPLQELAAQQGHNSNLERQVEVKRASRAATMAASDKLAQVHTLTWAWSAQTVRKQTTVAKLCM